uniref:ATP-dependent DNA helicase n=1 Tax=Brassica oleracea var. oleracea TaxID=109376 RepID=A0A0D3C318_BRAOL
MPQVAKTHSKDSNVLILDERSYDREALLETLVSIPKMTPEQRKIYDEILEAVNKERGGMFFVSGFGGTGKTFLWKLLSAGVRSRGDIALNVASSGIAYLLLQGGEETIYLSADSIDPTDTKAVNDEALDSDFLNNIKSVGSDFLERLHEVAVIPLPERLARATIQGRSRFHGETTPNEARSDVLRATQPDRSRGDDPGATQP